ncbi:MAG: VWA domain-containing protein [Myxococcota bacterium]
MRALQTATTASLLLFGATGALAADDDYEAYHDCVIVVLDASGSMEGEMPGSGITKMEAAKRSIKEVLANVSQNTWVGVLVFSGTGITDAWVRPLGPRDDPAQLSAAIDPIQPDGGTPLGAYIKLGADRLLQEREKQFGYGSYRLMIVTDGEAGDQDLVDRYTPDVMSRGITMDVIGVAMAGNHTLATRVHSYRRADDAASLERAVAEVFAEVTAAGVQGAAPGEGAFDLLAGLSPELALDIIGALAASGNHGIGEQPPEPEPDEAQAMAETGQPARETEDEAFPFRTLFWIAAAIVIVFIIIIIRAKAKKNA